MRVLLIVPDVTPALDTTPEIRTITSLHQVTVLNGVVRLRELYEIAQRGRYDILHFGTHGNSYAADDILSVARVAGAQLVFLNGCNTGKIASFLVAHGIPYTIATNVELSDMEAWKLPLALYEYLHRQEAKHPVVSYPQAFMNADNGDGDYSLLVSVERITTMATMLERVNKLETRFTWAVIIVGLLLAGGLGYWLF